VVKTAALQIADARAITISNIACRTHDPDRADRFASRWHTRACAPPLVLL